MTKTHALIILLILLFCCLAAFKIFSSRTSAPAITSVSPANNSTNVLSQTPITILFDQPVANPEPLIVTLNPKVIVDSQWLNPQTLTLKPSPEWQSSTAYQASISYNQQVLSQFQFTTNAYSVNELVEQTTEQAKNDYDYNVGLKQISQNYPWINFLAITKNDYQVVFDHDQRLYRIMIFKPSPGQNLDMIIKDASAAATFQGYSLNNPGYYLVGPDNQTIPLP